jgi:hypothetical protein
MREAAMFSSYLGSPELSESSGVSIDPLEAIVNQIEDDHVPSAWQIIHQLHSFPSPEEMAFRNSVKLHGRWQRAQALTGMRFWKTGDHVTIEYSYESTHGAVEQAQVRFTEVLALAYRQLAFRSDNGARGQKEVRCSSQSHWLSEVVSRWQQSMPARAAEAASAFAKLFRHYRVSSTNGCLDVVASSCRPI